jgi:cyclic pyranopterin phosphate synthase
MLKAIDKNMKISDIQLLHKAGGRSGDWHKR